MQKEKKISRIYSNYAYYQVELKMNDVLYVYSILFELEWIYLFESSIELTVPTRYISYRVDLPTHLCNQLAEILVPDIQNMNLFL